MRYVKLAQPRVYLRNRLDKVYNELEKLELDGLLVSNQSNISYLTGYNSRESYLLISNPSTSLGISPEPSRRTKKLNFFITDFRYVEEAKKVLRGFLIERVDGSIFDLIKELSVKLHLKKLGFEAKHLCFAEYKKIREKLGHVTDFVPTYDIVEFLRRVKTEEEIEKVEKAVHITMQAFKYAKTIIRPGIRERDLASRIGDFIKNKGASSFSFDIIVASGVNSSFPHHITSQRRLKNNEPLLIDMGVDFQGYKSDLTRVFFLGKINPIIKRVYDIVLRAQGKAIKHIKPNFPINKIDNIARQYITQKGYGCFFGHNLGHGIGLEVHEEPHITAKNNGGLWEGMIFTVEPAIYLPGRFGLRIEDMVLVTRKGARILSGDLDKSIENRTYHIA